MNWPFLNSGLVCAQSHAVRPRMLPLWYVAANGNSSQLSLGTVESGDQAPVSHIALRFASRRAGSLSRVSGVPFGYCPQWSTLFHSIRATFAVPELPLAYP